MLDTVTLGRTDLAVSRLCYGTNMLGTAIGQDEADAILDRFVALGGNVLDTARSYGDWVPDAPAGASERAIGSWLRRRGLAGRIVVATKGGQVDYRAGDWRPRVTPEHVAQDLAESLEHLGLGTVDLYWLHIDDPSVAVEALIDALAGHRRAGRIRWYGASNWAPERVEAANAYAARIGEPGFVALQPFWGLALPDPAAAAAQGYQQHYEGRYEGLHAAGLPMVPYAAQSGGYFAKRAAGGEAAVPEGLRARYANPANAARLAAAQAIAAARGTSVNSVVLAYLLNQPHQTIPIFGARSPEQVEDSVAAAALRLTPDELTRLRAS